MDKIIEYNTYYFLDSRTLSATLIGAKSINDPLEYTTTYDFSTNRVTNSTQPSQLACLSIGEYVACMYDKEWYIGMIQEVCEEEGDIKVGLYRISGSNPVSGCIRPVTGYPAGTGYEQKSGRITVPIVFLYELKNNYEKVKTQALFN